MFLTASVLCSLRLFKLEMEGQTIYRKPHHKVTKPGLSLSAGCRRNCPAEKEAIAGWILGCDHLVKNNERFLGYASTII